MLKRKKLAAKNREKRAQERLIERVSNLPTKRVRRKFVDLKPREQTRFVETDEMRRIKNLPSLAITAPRKIENQRIDMSDWSDEEIADYKRREEVAAQEIERKKKMVAPLANKMGYQYVGDAPPEIIRDLGKKV